MAYNKETGMYEGFIYIIFNDIDPEKVYIGQTLDTPEKRWNGHCSQIKNHTSTDKLHNKMEKYGKQHFAMDVLEHHKLPSKESLLKRLDEREIALIEKYDSYYNGLNGTKGGRGGMEHKMRPVQRFDLDGHFIAEYEATQDLKTEFDSVSTIYDCCLHNNAKYAYGSLWKYKDDDSPLPVLASDEKLEAIRRYYMLKQIKKYDYKGNLICIYNNAKDVLENEDITRRQLLNSCIGETAFAGGYVYRFIIDSFSTYKTYKPRQRIVEQYDLNNNLLGVYRSTREAERCTGVKNASIGKVCNGKLNTAGGYKWIYADSKGGDNVA